MEEEEQTTEEMTFDSDSMESIDDTDGDYPQDSQTGNISQYVRGQFSKAQRARETDEYRWLQAYRNYRGIYGDDVRFTSTEKSRIFVKVTKTKVLAAYGQISEVLLGNNKFPITINPTTLPEGVSESVHYEMNPQLRQESDEDVDLGSYEDRYGDLGFMEGQGKSPSQITLYPAMEAAKKMEKKIHDQLEESNAKKHLRSTSFECALFGTGVMKGPFALDKEYPRWNEEGDYEPEIKTVPKVSNVSIWNFYPDPEANCMEESEYVIERHKMSRHQLRALKKRPYFRSNEIDTAIAYGENYVKEWWEQAMEDEDTDVQSERFEVIEFWGNVDREVLEDHNVEIPKKLQDRDELSVNVWVCNDRVLRVVLNPFTPTLIPYYVVPYEVNPYSIFGIGVAENMDDTQQLMNGFMRMAVDNAALSGNLLIEIDEANLVPGQDLEVYPGKVFVRQSGAPGQAIFGTKFPNVSNENMQMFDKARILADESTGFPSFAHGQTGVSGVGRTASGISMLMSAANGSIRTVVKNVDDYLLAPIGKALFSFNMQFDFDPSIQGDLEVKAEGTQSLMANEVRSQRLMQFLSVVQNPALAPFARMDYIVREIAQSMDLDPDKVANSLEEAALQAELFKEMQAPMEGEEGMGGPQGGQPMPGTDPMDTQGSGGGMMGTGTAPTPGEQGFSGTPGGEGPVQ